MLGLLNKKETKLAAIAGAAVTMWTLHGCSGDDESADPPGDGDDPTNPDDVPPGGDESGACFGQGEFIDLVTTSRSGSAFTNKFDADCIACLNAIDPNAPEIEGVWTIYSVQEYMTDDWRQGAGACGIANWELRVPGNGGDGTYGDPADCSDAQFDAFVGVMTQRQLSKATVEVLACILCLGWPQQGMGDTAAKQDKLNECGATDIQVTCDENVVGGEWTDYIAVNEALIETRDNQGATPSSLVDQSATEAFAGCYVCMWTTLKQTDDESNNLDAFNRYTDQCGGSGEFNSRVPEMSDNWDAVMAGLYGDQSIYGPEGSFAQETQRIQ